MVAVRLKAKGGEENPFKIAILEEVLSPPANDVETVFSGIEGVRVSTYSSVQALLAAIRDENKPDLVLAPCAVDAFEGGLAGDVIKSACDRNSIQCKIAPKLEEIGALVSEILQSAA